MIPHATTWRGIIDQREREGTGFLVVDTDRFYECDTCLIGEATGLYGKTYGQLNAIDDRSNFNWRIKKAMNSNNYKKMRSLLTEIEQAAYDQFGKTQ